nr:uncharacterized protein LOC128704914 [Cherax quadricarinatus]
MKQVVLRSSKVGVVWVAVVMMGGIMGGVLAGPSTLTHHQQEHQQPQHPDTTEVSQDTHSQQQRDGKLFVLAKIPATQCVTTDTTNTLGTCMSSYQCTTSGGVSKGTCVKGLAVCCLITRTCKATSSLNNTHFVNPSASNTELGACTLTINHMNDNICQMRLDFISLELSQPDTNGNCATDFLAVTGGVSDVPMICGSNSGQHIYYDVDPKGGPVKVTIDRLIISLKTNTWNIKITQIACNSRYRGEASSACIRFSRLLKCPNSCLQHNIKLTLDPDFEHIRHRVILQAFVVGKRCVLYAGKYGISLIQHLLFHSSYPCCNKMVVDIVAATRQLANQDYGVCIKRADSYCGITYKRNTDLGNYGFTVSGQVLAVDPVLIGTFDAGSLDSQCPKDYVIIPGGRYTKYEPDPALYPADRYCGLGFPYSVTTTSQPFVMYVRTDGDELPDDANVGFSLDYQKRIIVYFWTTQDSTQSCLDDSRFYPSCLDDSRFYPELFGRLKILPSCLDDSRFYPELFGRLKILPRAVWTTQDSTQSCLDDQDSTQSCLDDSRFYPELFGRLKILPRAV